MSRPPKFDYDALEGKMPATSDELKAAIRSKFGQLTVSDTKPSSRKQFNVLDAAKRKIIISAVRRGNPLTVAAGMAQVGYSTLTKCLQWAKQELDEAEHLGEPPGDRAVFWLKLQSAQAWFLNDLKDKYEAAMEKDPRAAGFYLQLMERLHPELLGRRQVLKVEQDTTMTIEWREVSGSEWQSGKSRIRVDSVEDAPKAIAGEVAHLSNEIIDTQLRGGDDEDPDNVF